jgi:antitoxin VapB
MSAIDTPPDVAKVFTTGRSQAVRLPKAYRFDTAEVLIERQGDAVILRPKPGNKQAWRAKMEAVVNRFQGMPLNVERERGRIKPPVKLD